VPPNRLIAFTDAGGNCGGPAINISNGPAPSTFQMTGSIHAPNGCINMSSNTLSVNYSGTVSAGVVQIQMGNGMPWRFTGPAGGGGGGGTWSIIR